MSFFALKSLLPIALFAFAADARTGCKCSGLSFSSNGAIGQYPAMTDFNLLYNDESFFGPGPKNKPNDGYCIVDNVLTASTASNIATGILNDEDTAYVNKTGTDVWCYTNLKYTTRQQCVDYVQGKRQDNLANAGSLVACDYPTSNFEPTDCHCGFVCTNGYVRCGTNSCIDPATQVCQSGRPVSARNRRSEGVCPTGKRRCPVGSSGWECIDTRNDLESCGACPGHSGGVDCSALAGTGAVECKNGVCLVSSCLTDYNLSKNGTCVRA